MKEVRSLYGYTPSLAANVVACVVFGCILVFQLMAGAWTRDWWMFWTWGIGASLELVGYVARAISARRETGVGAYALQMSCLVFAPTFMAAGLYSQLGRALKIFGPRFSSRKPSTYTITFIVLDVCCLLIQCSGGGLAAASAGGVDENNTGIHLMLAGIALQLAVVTVFSVMYAYTYWRIMNGRAYWSNCFEKNRTRPLFKFWAPAVALSLLFLLIRSIYRVIELSGGWTSSLMRNEPNFMVLDGLMIALGMITLCLVYPKLAHGSLESGEPDTWSPKAEIDESGLVDYSYKLD